MTDSVTIDNAALAVKLFIGKAEENLFHLTRLCDVGSLIEDLLDAWQDGSPQSVQSQVLFGLFLEEICHRVETLHAIVRECNKEIYSESVAED